jgi:hypothetical protein
MFNAGDNVTIVTGLHRGTTGTVLCREEALLHVLTDDHGNYVSKYHPDSFVADFHLIRSQCHWNG